jgi:rare lipoprotein A
MIKMIQIAFVVALLPISACAEPTFLQRWLDIMKREPQSGEASIYWEGSRTANGEIFLPYHVDEHGRSTCAHRVEDFGTILRVTHNGRSIECRVNDRGPFHNGRVIDLTPPGAKALGINGVGYVRVERVEYAPALNPGKRSGSAADTRNVLAR